MQIGSVKAEYHPEKMQVILFPHNSISVLFDKDVIPVEKLDANTKYKDCAHVTFKKVNGIWKGFFDFRYNKDNAKTLFNTAQELFDTAKDAYSAGRLKVFVDNLFSSTELFIQSRLFMISKQSFIDKPNHKWTTSEFSKFVKLGNMDPLYSKTLGDLSRLRDEARYDKRPLSLKDSNAKEYINTVQELAKEVMSSFA
jgi:uncharacterized protein (UPF0332 family)